VEICLIVNISISSISFYQKLFKVVSVVHYITQLQVQGREDEVSELIKVKKLGIKYLDHSRQRRFKLESSTSLKNVLPISLLGT